LKVAGSSLSSGDSSERRPPKGEEVFERLGKLMVWISRMMTE